ncbi:hypothetical protein CKO28_23665 [Rhodovibrio sodomensis]|uniref:Uncharacterized protein n=1 Tax=Rhodovibrio sodomensis TaxID=1088 RepID=A0ABS1DLA3_9PROT|nr:hypothetical protein [Rhodovibrio sodomensis]MBK1671009.1 hypothetical protein [Rhodovibrio sodomensis]
MAVLSILDQYVDGDEQLVLSEPTQREVVLHAAPPTDLGFAWVALDGLAGHVTVMQGHQVLVHRPTDVVELISGRSDGGPAIVIRKLEPMTELVLASPGLARIWGGFGLVRPDRTRALLEGGGLAGVVRAIHDHAGRELPDDALGPRDLSAPVAAVWVRVEDKG